MIHIFILFYCFLFYSSYQMSDVDDMIFDRCTLGGEMSTELYGSLNAKIICYESFKVLSVGLVSGSREYFELLDLKHGYQEIPSFFHAYLLNFESDTIYLIDVDLHLHAKLFKFYVRFEDEKNESFTSIPITITFDKPSIISDQERIKNERYFINIPVLTFFRPFELNLGEYEEKYSIIFIAVNFITSNDKYKNRFFLKNYKNFSIEENIIIYNKKTIKIYARKNSARNMAICFEISKENKLILNSLRRFRFESPIKITRVTNKYIYWKLIFFLSEIIISHHINFILVYSSIGKCVRKQNRTVCERCNGQRSLFGELSENGIELVDPIVRNYFFKVSFNVFNTFDDKLFEFDNMIYLKEEINDEYLYTYDRNDFRNARVDIDFDLAREEGILNASNINFPVMRLSEKLYSTHIISFGSNNQPICCHFGSGKINFVSPYSIYLFECNVFYITFIDINQEYFNKITVMYFLKISKFEYLNTETKLFEYKNPTSKIKEYKSLFLSHHKTIYVEPVLLLNKINTHSIKLSTENYYITYMSIFMDQREIKGTDNFLEKFHINIDDSTLILSNRTIYFLGNPYSFNQFSIILYVTDGTSLLTKQTKPIKISENVIVPLSCFQGIISWRLVIYQYSFIIKLIYNGEEIIIGECNSITGCRHNENAYFSSLTKNNLILKPNHPLDKFELVFEVEVKFSEKFTKKITFTKYYDLESKECKNEPISQLPSLSHPLTYFADSEKYNFYFAKIINKEKYKQTDGHKFVFIICFSAILLSGTGFIFLFVLIKFIKKTRII